MSGARWWWVRHAPVLVEPGYCYGHLEVPIDLADVPALQRLAGRLPHEAQWFVSPLARARATLAAVCEAGGLPDRAPVVEPAIAEQHFGAWQGRLYEEFKADIGDAALSDLTTVEPPGGETFVAVLERVRRWVEAQAREAEGDIVLFAHGGSIRGALSAADGRSPTDALGTAIECLSLTRIESEVGPDGTVRWRVLGVNEAP